MAKQEASKEKIGILHPGQMGVVVAKTIRNSGHDVYWASAGRSTESRGRASEAGLTDAGSVERLCKICAAIVSVCPPEFAEALGLLAHQVHQVRPVDALGEAREVVDGRGQGQLPSRLAALEDEGSEVGPRRVQRDNGAAGPLLSKHSRTAGCLPSPSSRETCT